MPSASGSEAGGPPAPTASVVICVHTEDRWDDAVAAVASTLAQQPPPHEVIVVVDDNPALLRRAGAHFHDATVLANRYRPGLSGARNTGAHAATGDVVVFLDDDACARSGWLARLLDGYRDPHVLGVGGRAEPVWQHGRPRWWPTEFDWVVGCSYDGLAPGEVRNLMGCNASFRRSLFDGDGFNSGIGRQASARLPLGCEETEFCIRMRQRHPRGVFRYDDTAVVDHRVPAERARFAYFRRRCIAEGVSKAVIGGRVGARDALSNEWRYTAVTLPAGMLRGVREAATGQPAAALRALAIIAGLGLTAGGFAAQRCRGLFSGLFSGLLGYSRRTAA